MSFWKIFFGSLLAFVIGTFLVMLLVIGFLAALVSSFGGESAPVVKANSLLTLDLGYDIPEQTTYIPFRGFSFSDFKPAVAPGLYDIIRNIEKAKTDPSIKGIYLNSGFVGAGMAATTQLRNALLDFKDSGKFIVAYDEIYSEKGYYLSSVADKVIVNPSGLIEFNGMHAQYLFFKGLLEKAGIEAQVFYDGKFKSATEPFRLDSMSNENDLMTRALLQDIHQTVMDDIALSRKIARKELDSINANLLVQSCLDAKKFNLVDEIWFEDEVRDYLKEKAGIAEKDKLEQVTLANYLAVPGKKEEKTLQTAKIALLFASGDIVDGQGDDETVGSEKFVKQLRKLREDDKVKAIVFRVNSPGGSALASDVISREVALTAAKKPLVVSMGDYAASGGYFIAAHASKIVAEPSTLTGSIGVFGIYPNFQKLFNDKLGVNFDGVQTGRYSDFGDVSRPMRSDEKLIVQRAVDTIYSRFKATVVKGRKISPGMVDTISQGRVWTGRQALEFGLVDTLGGINDAIAMAARLASLEDYRIVEYPEIDKEMFEVVRMFRDEQERNAIKEQLGSFYTVYEQLQGFTNMKGAQARMPVMIELE